MVNSYNDRDGAESIVFTKGDTHRDGVVYCPRVTVRQRGGENEMVVRVNTFSEQSETVIISNMPVKKWVHCAIVVKDENVMVYVNGRIKKAVPVSGVIMQNYGDLGVGVSGGFSGMLSDLTYYRYAVSATDLNNSISNGPNKTLVGVTSDYPPYFGDAWWVQ